MIEGTPSSNLNFDLIDTTSASSAIYMSHVYKKVDAEDNQNKEDFLGDLIKKVQEVASDFFDYCAELIQNPMVQFGCLSTYLFFVQESSLLGSMVTSASMAVLFNSFKTVIDVWQKNKGQSSSGSSISFCENLVQAARKKAFPTFHGREEDTNQLIQILLKEEKNNAVLVGPAGCGKTALVKNLAQRISEGRVPDELKDKEIMSLDLLSLIAGTTYRGDFEQRLYSILTKLKAHPDRYILFIDEAHLISQAGETKNNGSQTLANFLKPALAEGLRCVAATTPEEYKQYLGTDKALMRRFEVQSVESLKGKDMLKILEEIKEDRFEKRYNIKIDSSLLPLVIHYAHKMIPNVFPDAPLSFLDTACSAARLQNESVLTKECVEKTFKKMFTVPDELLQPLQDRPTEGVINGLTANTMGGGSVMPIQVTKMFSEKAFEIKVTGLPGEILSESVEIAKDLAWNLLPTEKRKNLFKDEKYGFHIHFPSGAVPKDGPSAGAAITCAILSRLAHLPLRHDIAVTGEIDSLGVITVVGGIKEKLQAAKDRDMKVVFIPRGCKEQLDELIDDDPTCVARVHEKSPEVLEYTSEGLQVVLVDSIQEVTQHVFSDKPSHLSAVA